MTTKIFEEFNLPIGFKPLVKPVEQVDSRNCEELLCALHDLLTSTEAINTFKHVKVTDENFTEYKKAAYFESVTRCKARRLLKEAGRFP